MSPEELIKIDPSEFAHCYSDSFIGIKKGDNNIEAAKFYSLEGTYNEDSNEDTLVLYFYYLNNTTKNVKPSFNSKKFSGTNWVFDCPTVGIININESVLYLEASGSRKWKRGLNRGRYNYSFPLGIELETLKMYPVEINYRIFTKQVVEAIFINQQYSVEKALQDVREFKALSRGFNNKYYFANTGLSDKIAVGYKNIKCIGTVEQDNTVKLNKGFNHLREELNNYIICRNET